MPPKKRAGASKSPKSRASPRSQSPRGRASPRSQSPRGRPKTKAKAPAGDLAAELKEARADITWFKRPVSVVRLFLLALKDLGIEYGTYLLEHPYTRFVLLPAVVGWLWASEVEGAHRSQMAEITACVEFVVWWVTLGILSSVGLGSGMHTGILFLFPHIFKVTWTAEMVCGHADFDTRQNMFWRLPSAEWFACDSDPLTGGAADLWLSIYWKALPAAFFWGAGTAMGEIPPYWTAYAAKMSGETDDEEINEVNELSAHSGEVADPLTATKIWMVKFMEKYGFWGVFIMSAWPNALFDLCGICCGSCLMPFWHFFTACWLGKACVKAPAQLVVLITLFSEHYREAYLTATTAFVSRVPIVGAGFAEKLNAGVAKLLAKSKGGDVAEEEGGGVGVKDVFEWAMFLLIGTFALSCIEQFAQAQQRYYDEQMMDSIRSTNGNAQMVKNGKKK